MWIDEGIAVGKGCTAQMGQGAEVEPGSSVAVKHWARPKNLQEGSRLPEGGQHLCQEG